jgi:hypothetical protein
MTSMVFVNKNKNLFHLFHPHYLRAQQLNRNENLVESLIQSHFLFPTFRGLTLAFSFSRKDSIRLSIAYSPKNKHVMPASVIYDNLAMQ